MRTTRRKRRMRRACVVAVALATLAGAHGPNAPQAHAARWRFWRGPTHRLARRDIPRIAQTDRLRRRRARWRHVGKELRDIGLGMLVIIGTMAAAVPLSHCMVNRIRTLSTRTAAPPAEIHHAIRPNAAGPATLPQIGEGLTGSPREQE